MLLREPKTPCRRSLKPSRSTRRWVRSWTSSAPSSATIWNLPSFRGKLEQVMSDNPRQGLIKKQILTESEVTEIERLACICNSHENLHMRIGWIKLRPQQREETNDFFFNDFLFYEDGILAGYLVLDDHGTTARELTGMVHPDYRRKGIFTALLAAAKEECRGRGVRKLILICEDSSRSGRACVAATGAHYESSEYRMELETFRGKEIFDDRLFFRQANESDLEALIAILVDGFDETVEE